MPRVFPVLAFCAACLASAPSQGEEAVARIGKQRASTSSVEWDVKDVSHPALGPIRFASRKAAVATRAGDETIVSQVFVSCQKGNGKIALEFSNAFASNPAGGLGPREIPLLTCYSPDPKVAGAMLMREVAAKWEISNLGDTLARGLSPSELRRCVSIDVLQDVALPAGSAQASQQVLMELLPYGRALDAVFAACGERTAFGSAPVSPADSAKPTPAAAQWKPARTVAKGGTNVREAARVDSPLVVKLAPGTKLLVLHASTDWWTVKPRSGTGFSGYVRRDRLVFE